MTAARVPPPTLCSPSRRGGIGGRGARSWRDPRGAFVAVLVAWCLVALGLAPGAWAQGAAESKSLAAQYVLLLDDSGSMQSNDPDRLAVFAARSMLALLDDKDEVSVVRLNGAIEGEQAAGLQPLGQVRGDYEKLLDNTGKIASYKGGATPCTPALEGVKKLLNASRKKHTRQVVVYLTDGACELGSGADSVSPEAFLGGVDSARDQELFFYLLRFAGKPYTKSLDVLTAKTGAASFELTADATGILQPFARALSQAQGFDAFEVTPDEPTIAAHSAAKRVRLLAVAEGEGAALAIEFKGSKPKLLGDPRTGVHRFEGKRSYRYVALDYLPGKSKVEVDVKNAGPKWKLIAIPEYRLRLETVVRSGACGEAGSTVQTIDTGKTLCVEARLLNDASEPVTPEGLGGSVEFVVSYLAPGDEAPKELPLNLAKGQLVATLERANLKGGDHVFRPSAKLTLGTGKPFPLRGEPRTVQATSATMNLAPKDWAAGTVVPGEARSTKVTLAGNFPKVDGTFKVQRPEGFPACVHFTLSGTEEGGMLPLANGQEYTLALRVDTLCSLTTFQRDLQATVRLDAKGYPAAELGFTAKLDAQVTLPDSLEIDASRAGPVSVDVPIRGNHRGDLRFGLALAPGAAGWPGDELALGVAVPSADGRTPSAALAASGEVTIGQDGASKGGPKLWTEVKACCGPGEYKTTLTLSVPGSQETRQLPVVVRVPAGSWWACHGGQVKLGLLALGVLTTWGMLRNLWRNSHTIQLTKKGSKKMVLGSNLYHFKMETKEMEYLPKVLRVPTPVERFLWWMRTGGLATALGRTHWFEVMQMELDGLRPDHASGRGALPVRLKLSAPLRSVGIEGERLMARKRLPRNAGQIFVLAPLKAGRPSTFVRVRTNEPTIPLPYGDFLAIQEGTEESVGEFGAIKLTADVSLDKAGPNGKPDKKEAMKLVGVTLS
jgi:hypothetical protein